MCTSLIFQLSIHITDVPRKKENESIWNESENKITSTDIKYHL